MARKKQEEGDYSFFLMKRDIKTHWSVSFLSWRTLCESHEHYTLYTGLMFFAEMKLRD